MAHRRRGGARSEERQRHRSKTCERSGDARAAVNALKTGVRAGRYEPPGRHTRIATEGIDERDGRQERVAARMAAGALNPHGIADG